MTATYKLEAIEDGEWTTVHESSDPFTIMQPTLDLSAKQRSTRTTVIYGDDKLAKPQHPDARIAAALDKFDADPTADIEVKIDGSVRGSTLGVLDPDYVEQLQKQHPEAGIQRLRVDETAVSQKHEIKPAPQQPTIGRIVHYYQGALKRVVPAIVTEIGEIPKGSQVADVKLHVFWGGGAEDRSQGGWYTFRDEYTSGCWSWPPRA